MVKVTKINTLIKNIRENAHNLEEYSKKLKKSELEKIILKANKEYYNSKTGNTLITDQEFDILKDALIERFPKSKVIHDVGAPILGSEEKVNLPYWLGSMDKIKPGSKELDRWIQKYSWAICNH